MNSSAAKLSGLGLTPLLVWIWNDLVAKAWGLAPIPAEAAAALTGLVVALADRWLGPAPAGGAP